MPENVQKLREIKVQEFSNPDFNTVIDQVQAFLTRGGKADAPDPKPATEEARLLEWQYQADGGDHFIVLIYTE